MNSCVMSVTDKQKKLTIEAKNNLVFAYCSVEGLETKVYTLLCVACVNFS